MTVRKLFLCALAFVATGLAPANAATSTVSFTFDATLSAGNVYCGPSAYFAEHCVDELGAHADSKADLLMLGKSINGVYKGRIELGFEDGAVSYAACDLGGADCFFGDDFLNGPFGDDATLHFSSYTVLSKFEIAGDAGSYFFGSDGFKDDDGVRFYEGVQFDLSGVERSDLAVVPLMGSAGFLVLALGGFAAVSRRKSRLL